MKWYPNKQQTIGIEVKITDHCNLSCFHCMNNDGPLTDHNIEADVFIKRLIEFQETKKEAPYRIDHVRITGGEPLMNLGTALKIANNCKSLGISCGINTNGLFLNETVAKKLKDAGILIVKISYDSTDNDTLSQIRGIEISREKIEKAICIAKEYGFRVILRLTLSKHNLSQLYDCFLRARELKVEKLQIKPLIPSGRAINSNAFLSRKELQGAFSKIKEVTKSVSGYPDVSCCPPEIAFGLVRKICSSINKIYISPTGEVSICNYIDDDSSIGNIHNSSLEELVEMRDINHSVYKQFNVIKGCPITTCFV